MRIHREGFIIILGASLICVGLSYVMMTWLKPVPLAQILSIGLLVFLGLVVQFFRDPKRHTAMNDDHIIAPADGKVVVIEEIEETEFLKDKRVQISIFMSPLNVHVNRNPIGGIVKYAKYHPGKYLVAWHPKASTDNERTTMVIGNHNGQVLFRQIAGAVARRIRYYIKENDQVRQGAEMGFIKFGSRVDVICPKNVKINVKIGDKVRGGETILAEFL
jgi:phosphatidylserine decarboxylase